MGFFSKLFGSKINCPRCGNPAAVDSFSGVKCPSSDCVNYVGFQSGGSNIEIAPDLESREKSRASSTNRAAPGASAARGNSIVVDYQNHKGENKRFTVYPKTAKDKGLFISVVAEPSGQRISLRKAKLSANLVSAAEEIKQSEPSGREKHILEYHRLNNSTSPRCQEIKKKYGISN